MENAEPRHWLAAYTRSLHEARVAEQLNHKGVESLLPTFEKLARWSDRFRRMQAPLFPGYVFVHVSERERVPVLQTSGVVHIVSVAGKPAPLSEGDIQRLKTCGQHSAQMEPHPFLTLGQRVRVKHGPFAGWEGVLVEKQNRTRLVMKVDAIQRAVAINLHGADVEAVM